jgi:hypothetical protein
MVDLSRSVFESKNRKTNSIQLRQHLILLWGICLILKDPLLFKLVVFKKVTEIYINTMKDHNLQQVRHSFSYLQVLI